MTACPKCGADGFASGRCPSCGLDEGAIAALMAKGKAQLEAEELEGAQKTFEAVLSVDAEHRPALSFLGYTYYKLGMFDEAVNTLERLVKLDPKDAGGWYNRGMALDELGEYELAAESYQKVLEIDPRDGEALFNRGMDLYRLGRLSEAREVFESLTRFDPTNVDAWYNLGNCLFNLGRFEESLGCYDKVLAQRPQSGKAWYSKGVVYDNLGRYENAMMCYDRATKIDPNVPEIWLAKGIVLDELGRYKEAVRSYQRVLELDKRSAEALMRLADTLANMGEPRQALDAVDALLKIDPEDAKAWATKGTLLDDLGRHEQALACYEKARALGKMREEGKADEGQALLKLGKYAEAIEAFDNALNADPDLHAAWAGKGRALMALRRRHDARVCFERALGIDPHDPQALAGIAETQFMEGRFDEAVRGFARAVEEAPDDVEILLRSARALFALGRFAEANRVIEGVLRVDERNETALELRELMEIAPKPHLVGTGDERKDQLFDSYWRAHRALESVRARLELVDALEADVNAGEAYIEGVTALMEGDYPRAKEAADQALVEMDKALRRIFTQRLKALSKRVEGAQRFVSTEALQARLSEARAQLEQLEYLAVNESIARINEEVTRAQKQYEATQDALQMAWQRCAEAQAAGLETQSALDLLSKAREAMRAGELGSAHDLANQAKAVAEAIKKDYQDAADTISDLRELVRELKGYGANVVEVELLLNQAWEAFEAGQFQKALSSAQLAEQAAAEPKSQFRYERVQRQIPQIESLIGMLKTLGGEVGSAEEDLRAAQKALERRDYEAAERRMEEAKRGADAVKRQVLTQKANESIERVVEAIEKAKSRGADTTVAERLLRRARFALRSENFVKSEEYARRARAEVKKAREAHREQLASKSLREVQEAVASLGQLDVDVSDAENMILEAVGAYDRKDFKGCLRLVREAEVLVQRAKDRVRGAKALEAILMAQSAISEGKRAGASLPKVEAVVSEAKAAYEEGRYEAAEERARLAQQAISSQVQEVRALLVKQAIQEAGAAVERSRSAKADVSEPDRLLAEANHALDAGDLEKAERLAHAAREGAQEALHLFQGQWVYNRVASIRQVLEYLQSHGVEIRDARRTLNRGIRLYNSERYEESARWVIRAFEMARELRREFEDAKRPGTIKARPEAVRVVEPWRESGVSGASEEAAGAAEAAGATADRPAQPPGELAAAAATPAGGGAEGGMTDRIPLGEPDGETAEEVLDIVDGKGPDEEAGLAISSAQAEIGRVAQLEVDVSEAQETLIAALESYDGSEFDAAVRLALKARDLAAKAERDAYADKARKSMADAEEILAEVQGLGIETSGLHDLLEKAKGAYGRGEFEGAYTFARECLRQIQGPGEMKAAVILLQKARDGLREARSGMGVPPGAERAYEEGVDALRKRRFEEVQTKAEACLTLLARRAREVQGVRERLDRLGRETEKAHGLGVTVTRVQRLHSEAEKALGLGDLKEAEKQLSEAESALRIAFEKRATEELNTVRGLLERSKKQEAGMARPRALFRRAEAAVSEGAYARGMGYLRQCREVVETLTETKALAEAQVRALEARIRKVAQAGAPVFKAQEMLEAMRTQVAAKDYKGAVSTARECEAVLEESYRQFQACVAIYYRVDGRIKEAEGKGVKVEEAKVLLRRMSPFVNQAEFDQAKDQARRAEAKVNETVDKFNRVIRVGRKAQSLITGAAEIGLHVEAEKHLLDDALVSLREGNYDRALEQANEAYRLISGLRTLYNKARDATQKAWMQVRVVREIGAATTEAESELKEARRAMLEGNYRQALESCRRCNVALFRTKRLYQDAVDTIPIAWKRISAAQARGVDVAPSKEMLLKARRAIQGGRYQEAVDHARQAIAAAEGRLSEYQEVAPIIHSVLARLHEAHAQGTDIARAEKVYDEMRRAVEGADYPTALAKARECLDAIEQVRQRKAESLVKELEDRMIALKRMGVNVQKVEDLILQARGAVFRNMLEEAAKWKGEAEQALETVESGLRPKLTVRATWPSVIRIGAWSEMELFITNTGFAPAEEVAPEIEGVEVLGLHPLPRLAPKEGAKVACEIQPGIIGRLPIQIRIRYRDVDGPHVVEEVAWIESEPKEEESGFGTIVFATAESPAAVEPAADMFDPAAPDRTVHARVEPPPEGVDAADEGGGLGPDVGEIVKVMEETFRASADRLKKGR